MTISLAMENITLTQMCWVRLMCGTRREVNTQCFHTGKLKKTNKKQIPLCTNFSSCIVFLFRLCPLVVYFIVKEAFEKGANPIIIDNTNMQGWEMRPYVAQVSVENFLMDLMWPLYLL